MVYHCHHFRTTTTVSSSPQLQENPVFQGVMPPVKDVQFELSQQALATMLDGLEKIQGQLGSINAR